MGSCLSKKSSCTTPSVSLLKPLKKPKSESQVNQHKADEESLAKKDIFRVESCMIERQIRMDEGSGEDNGNGHRKSGSFSNGGLAKVGEGAAAPVRTSSCSKEELDAILIQCGRLSRSNSMGKAAHSPAKNRSYDFDNEKGDEGEDCTVARERENRRRERRRTPSRERDKDRAGQPRSGSRERRSSGGRRVSRSPRRRSESPINRNQANSNSNPFADRVNSRPGKMVAVPATMSPPVTDESSNGMERMQMKRAVASPHARSPGRARASSENQNGNQPQATLGRSNSRKTENSPYRRNPLSEIDSNIITQIPAKKPHADNRKVLPGEKSLNGKNQEQQLKAEENKGALGIRGQVVVNVVASGHQSLKPQTVARQGASRLSRDLDINPDILTNPNASSYATLLLEDIQNFHQNNNLPAVLSLPPGVTKACSAPDSVADLNSSASPNPLSAFCEEDMRRYASFEEMSKLDNKLTSGKTKPDIRDPIMESAVAANDDLMETTFHRYVTVRRDTAGGENSIEKEPSEENGFAQSQKQQALIA